MEPKPKKESLASKVVFAVALLILLLVMGACVFVVYDYLSPPGSAGTPSPAPVPTPTVKPTRTATPTKVNTPGPEYYQQDTRVTTTNYDFSSPGIWDHYIVYDAYDGRKNYTMLYDISSEETKQIADGTVFSYGIISNGKVLLYYPLIRRMSLYSIDEGTASPAGTDDDFEKGSFTMFGTRLAYYDDMGNFDNEGKWVPFYSIFASSTTRGKPSIVADNIPKPLDTKIYEDKLVYTAGSDVYFLNTSIQGAVPQKISTGMGDNNYARIYDDTVVYHSDVGSKHFINVYDINTRDTMSLATKGQQYHADIYGDTIVYDDSVDGNWNIYAYDLSSRSERQITNEPHDQMDPKIYGNRIVYMDKRNGRWDIYTMSI